MIIWDFPFVILMRSSSVLLTYIEMCYFQVEKESDIASSIFPTISNCAGGN